MKSRVVLQLFVLAAFCILANRQPWREHTIISWDASGYYLYLPAIFISHDLAQLDTTDVRYRYAQDMPSYGVSIDTTTSRRICKYPIGVALLEAPFFCAVHYLIVRPFITAYPADGYSIPYQLAFACATLFWAALGLLFLRRLLRRYYSDGVVAVVLLVIAFGTNLYLYTIFQPGWSHPFTFFLYCCLLERVDVWRSGLRQSKPLPVIGLLLGLLIITRPTNIIALLIPLLWPAVKGHKLLLKMLPHYLLAAAIFGAVCFLQMSYWHYATGRWIYYSYGDEGFDFRHPHLWQGLFSYRKGWLVYTPVAFIMLAGLPLLWRTHWRWLLICGAVLVLHVYIAFSWRIWHYGGGFTSRPMVDILPVLSLPLAALIAIAFKRKGTRIALSVTLVLLMALNMFQTYQYSIGLLHYNGMSRAYYWRSFGRLKVTEEDKKLLLKPDEAPYRDEDVK